MKSDTLQKARALIEDPSHWTQFDACTPSGRRCAGGAVFRVYYGWDYYADSRCAQEAAAIHSLTQYLEDAAQALFSEPAIDVNNYRDHEAVLAMFDVAISAALSDEAVGTHGVCEP